MAKVAILIGSHLSSAPRPFKEARAFLKAGHEVTIYGVWFDSILARYDRELSEKYSICYVPVLDFRKEKWIANVLTRSRQRLARLLYQRTRKVLPDLYGYGAKALFDTVRKAQPDIAIAHSEASLYAASRLSEEGIRVGIDFEDWFSRDLPLQSRDGRPVAEIEKIEMEFLRQRSVFTLAPSKSMSIAMQRVSGATHAPRVIYNTFYKEDVDRIDNEKKDRRDPEKLSLHWFSHTIGPGRGLELLFRALKYITVPLEVHLRGAYPQTSRAYFDEYLRGVEQHQIYFHERVPPEELLSRIAEHDIGLALESAEVESTDLTVSNKLFQYMLAGCCVIATDTTGQQEVMSSWASPEQIVNDHDERSLADALSHYIKNPQELSKAKQRSRQIALKEYAYDSQEEEICKALEEALRL